MSALPDDFNVAKNHEKTKVLFTPTACISLPLDVPGLMLVKAEKWKCKEMARQHGGDSQENFLTSEKRATAMLLGMAGAALSLYNFMNWRKPSCHGMRPVVFGRSRVGGPGCEERQEGRSQRLTADSREGGQKSPLLKNDACRGKCLLVPLCGVLASAPDAAGRDWAEELLRLQAATINPSC